MGKLFIMPVILATVHLSASLSSSSQGNNEKEDLSPCLPSSSVFFKGNCISCANPHEFGDFQNESSLDASIVNDSLHESRVFFCSEQVDLETAKVNEGKVFLNGNILRVVTIERQPFVKTGRSQEFTGVVFELLNALSEKYNFTSTVFLPYDGNWGSQDNGTWNGMVGQVKRDEADVGAAPFSVTLERAKVVDFSMPFHQEPAGILIPAPQPSNKLTILIRPLSAEVWLAVFTTICVLVPSLFVMHIVSLRLRSQFDTQAPPHKPVNMLRLIVDLVQFIVGSFVQEGLVSPVNKTTRFVVGIWWFLTLVLANVYVGYMVSFLSAPKLFDVVSGLEDLVRQRGIRWSYRKNTALEDLFQSSTSGVYKAIGAGAREGDLTLSDIAGLEKVLSGHFAFLKEKSFLDVAIANDFDSSHQCRVTMARETFFTVGFALIVQKGCAFLELLDREILNVVTTGLMEQWKGMHWPRHLQCLDAAQYIVSTQPKARKLTLDDCQGAYLLLFVGLTLSSVSFVGELLRRRKWTGSSSWKWKLLRWWHPPTFTESIKEDEMQKQLKGYKIIVIPVKEDIYHKIHKLSLFKVSRK